MSEPSIEILGQKFAYPTTWKGAFSIFVVGASMSFIVWTIEPQQIDSFSHLLNDKNDKVVEERYLSLNQKLSEEVVLLKSEILKLTANRINKSAIREKINKNNLEIKNAYDKLIEAQKTRELTITKTAPKSSVKIKIDQDELNDILNKLTRSREKLQAINEEF